MTVVDAIGWICTAAVLCAYAVAARRPDRIVWFHAANAIGALGIGASAVSHDAWPSLALTAAFGLIGLAGWLHRTRPCQCPWDLVEQQRITEWTCPTHGHLSVTWNEQTR